MARRLLKSRKIPERNQYHNNAICATDAREFGATLAEEPTTRHDQLLEAISRLLHRKLQIHLQATSITRGTKSLPKRNQRVSASIHLAVDYTQEFSRGYIR